MREIKAAIVGGTGYGGMELLRYLLGHPHAKVTAITSRTESGAVGDVHPHLRGLTSLKFTAEKAADLAKDNDVLFFATPHGVADKEADGVLSANPGARLIDLSQDFRAKVFLPPEPYAAKYGQSRPAWLEGAAYGLPECGGREQVLSPSCRLVSNPGCHASAAILALYPVARAGIWSGRPPVTVVSVTGSSGSGATPSQATHHPERFANFRAYKPLQHAHVPEMKAALTRFAGADDPMIAFVPCSGPFARGIGNAVVLHLGTVFLNRGIDPKDDAACLDAARTVFKAAYENEPFVRLVPDTAEVRAVAGTNFADIGLAAHQGAVCVTVAIDNLGKGMAGTAVQNMNLLFGLEETAGLLRPGPGL